MSTENRYAATTWGGSPYTELDVPSGQRCLARKLQPIDLVAGNLLGGTDLLAQVVQENITAAKAGPQDHLAKKTVRQELEAEKIAAILGQTLGTPEGLDSMIDSVVLKAVVEPRIEAAPQDFADRVDDVVYIDTIQFSDKMFIFNWVMSGLDRVKSFRQQSDAAVETVELGEGLSHPTE